MQLTVQSAGVLLRASVTISDIARALEITAGTVSRALRSDPRVKAATTEKVLAKAEELGYVPNRAARRLVKGASETITLVLGSLSWVQERRFVEACNRLLWQRGYRTQIMLHDNDEKKFREICMDCAMGNSDGVMILPCLDIPLEVGLKGLEIPCVLIDRWYDALDVPVVTTEQEAGAQALVSAAFRSIEGSCALLHCGEVLNLVEEERLAGVRLACSKLGLSFYEEHPCEHPHRDIVEGKFDNVICYGNSLHRVQTAISSLSTDGLNGTSWRACVWDEWQGGTEPFTDIFVAHQDFEALAKAAIERWLAELAQPSGKDSKQERQLLQRVDISHVEHLTRG